ncbi:hypothetical protein BJY01DRAFT_253493 [Aspergillus pseudoustus]|uniref:NADH:flavin oxidoreductase/NADH oxidase N-terminal domain-containing protein n=1 Tax=Aspergillus pseudoustus TaxID=1810923 RepID=A0ABR4J0G0_9EURO
MPNLFDPLTFEDLTLRNRICMENEGMHGLPVSAPSPIPATGGRYRTLPGEPGHSANITEIEDPKVIVEQYRHSVSPAKDAGFDGVELLCQG